jgi:hypothetical protein
MCNHPKCRCSCKKTTKFCPGKTTTSSAQTPSRSQISWHHLSRTRPNMRHKIGWSNMLMHDPKLVWREVQRLIPAAMAIKCLSASPTSTTASFLPAAALLSNLTQTRCIRCSVQTPNSTPQPSHLMNGNSIQAVSHTTASTKPYSTNCEDHEPDI